MHVKDKHIEKLAKSRIILLVLYSIVPLHYTFIQMHGEMQNLKINI